METDNVVCIVNSKPVKIVDSDIAAGLAKTTGWKTWGSALVAGKFLSINDELIKNKNTGWGVDPQNEKQLINILHKIDKTGEKEFLEKQMNCLKIINTIKNVSEIIA